MKKVYLIEYIQINNYDHENAFTHKITAYSTMKNAWKALLNLVAEEPRKQTQYIKNLDIKNKPEYADMSLPKPDCKLLSIKYGKITTTAKIIETDIITGVKDE